MMTHTAFSDKYAATVTFLTKRL